MDKKIWNAWDGVSPYFASQKYPRGVLQDAGSQLFTSKTVPLVGCSDLYMAAEEIRIRELAFTCATNLIANILGNCEMKTYGSRQPIKGAEYYTWNVSPNPLQTSSEFWHTLVYKLFRHNEALVIPLKRSGRNQLLIADGWEASQFDPNRDTIYSGVVVNGYQYARTFAESEVLHLKLQQMDTAKVVDAINQSYYKLFEAAAKSFKTGSGVHLKVHVSRTESGDPKFKETLAKIMEDQVKPWINSDRSVLIEFDGYNYEILWPGTDGQTSRDIRELVNDVFDFTFSAFCIPSALIHGTATNMAEVVTQMMTFCIDPLAAMISEEATRKRYSFREWQRGDFLQLDTSTVQHFDIFANANNIEKLVGSGAFSINEILNAAGRSEIDAEWAKMHWLTLNISNIEQAARAAENETQ